MKKQNAKTLKISVLLVFWAALFNACGYTSNRDLTKNTDEQRIEVAQTLIDLYQNLDERIYRDTYQKDLMHILITQLDTSGYYAVRTPATTAADFLEQRVVQFGQLKQFYEMCHDLKQEENPEITAAGSAFLFHVVDTALIVPPDSLPQPLQQAFSDVTLQLKDIRASKKMANMEQLVALVTKFYIYLWENDVLKINTYIDEVYDVYARDIENLPLHIFDAGKIRELINEPYQDKAILVRLYKRQMLNELEVNRLSVRDEIENISMALQLFDKLNENMQKERVNNSEIMQLIEDIDQLTAVDLQQTVGQADVEQTRNE